MSTVRIETKSCELQLVKYPWALLAFGMHCSAVCWVWHGNTATNGTNRWQSKVWFLPPHPLTCQPKGLTGQYCEGNKHTDCWWNTVQRRASKPQQEENKLKIGPTLSSAIYNWALLPSDKLSLWSMSDAQASGCAFAQLQCHSYVYALCLLLNPSGYLLPHVLFSRKSFATLFLYPKFVDGLMQ